MKKEKKIRRRSFRATRAVAGYFKMRSDHEQRKSNQAQKKMTVIHRDKSEKGLF